MFFRKIIHISSFSLLTNQTLSSIFIPISTTKGYLAPPLCW